MFWLCQWIHIHHPDGFTTGSVDVTEALEIVVTPAATTTSTSLCFTCASEYTSTTQTVITTGSVDVTEALEIVVTPAATTTSTSLCFTCASEYTSTTQTVITTRSVDATEALEIVVVTV
ncbi:unnamed protein product [[Candida] boidinii]|uniref:Unnamed protein product n=1 Tax=Candida boidinii TaxID=5477 RepID=A0ACB5U7U2_CANBO|nr:unnamed protein product [[Candida] boidinii]